MIYYICPNMCVKLNYDEAIANNFHCPKCDAMLQHLDCSEAIKKIREEIEMIDNLLASL